MAYDSSTKVISAPVSIRDLQRCVPVSLVRTNSSTHQTERASSNDLGVLVGSQQGDTIPASDGKGNWTVQSRTPVNSWSKYKPVGKNKLDTTDELNSDKTWKNTATWWKGNNTTITVPAGTQIGNYTTISTAKWFIRCGMRILGFSSTVDVLGAYNPVSNSCNQSNIASSLLRLNYGFVPPAGGANEPYRLIDFNQYKHDADCRILTDYETSLGVQRVLVKSGDSNPVYGKCQLWTYPSDGGYADTLDIDDLFSSIQFTVVCGAIDGNSLVPVGVSVVDDGTQTDYYRAKKLNLNISQCWDKTIIGIYCMVITDGGTSYYVPVMQTNSVYYPNNPIVVTSAVLRVYKAWRVEQTSNPLPGDMTFGQKQNYGTSYAFSDPAVVKSWTFNTSTSMDRWYLKINMPKESSSYTVTPNSFRIEFTGLFIDKNNRQQYASYVVEPTSTVSFILRNTEPNAADWSPTESSISIQDGTGTQAVYLGIYGLFAAMKQLYNSGTIWQIRLMEGNPGGDFTVKHEVVYGSVSDTNNRLSVDF